MSLDAPILSPQQSAPSGTPPSSSNSEPQEQPQGQQGADPSGSQQPSAPAAEQQQEAQREADWRAAMAGDDPKALDVFARYADPAALGKAFLEQRAKLSQRAEPARLPENATPEQVGEWRKSLGLPELKADAKPDDFVAAYKIEPPKGYEMSEVEKGMLGDFAKEAYAKGWSPAEVKGAADFFFQQQAASLQAQNKMAVDFQKAELNKLRDKLGSAEFEAQQEAGKAWLQSQFGDDQDTLVNVLNARMPNGGRLGDSAWFFDLIASQAMQSGYTDRIVGNSIESAGGKSLAQQQQEIEALQFTNKAAYDDAARPGGKLDQIYAARQARGEIDEAGNEVRRRRSS